MGRPFVQLGASAMGNKVEVIGPDWGKEATARPGGDPVRVDPTMTSDGRSKQYI